jgi:23S rRNA (pseudouridine1915-N3)-methyltransferase
VGRDDEYARLVIYRLLAVDKVREPYIAAAAEDFRKRLRRLIPLNEIEIPRAHGGEPERAMREEAERILGELEPSDPTWLLERTGTAFSSLQLVEKLADVEREGTQRLTLIIAGAYGAHATLRARANLLWSLGPLTFPHEWARAIVLEQLYRTAKIARNEPYHY